MESEATRRIRELEASDDDFSDWLIELNGPTDERTYTARSGKTYKDTSSKGDGYWCPTHTPCFKRCDDRRWGKFGAAGILFYHKATGTFLLNQRSAAIHHGETWSTLGGAIDKNETPFAGALREAIEEIGNAPESLQVRVTHENVTEGEDGTDWTYTTFVVEVDEQFFATKTDWESKDNQWVTLQEMVALPLHPGFKSTISDLLTEMYMEGMMR